MSVFYHLPILGLALFTAVVLTGCESKSKRDFKAGCQSGGTDRSSCSCVYDKLEAHYSPAVMEKLAQQNVSRLDLPQDFGEQMYRAAQTCQTS
ncbi:hypothetical protein [Acinetobacter sp. AG3]|uniref:hypothetical protein n=1 Tax=Acinetobacter TaxID=469 RepID=UPI001EF03312|nr:hypothetical protein [Acinetobacter sp. AG3]MCG7220105.1 hypothetical protein [Acinetobacter sp. AG3]